MKLRGDLLRPVAGNLHLHKYYNFTGVSLTVPRSLRPSCGSELTRQGFSLPKDRYSYGRGLLGLRFAPSLTLSTPLNLPAPGRRQPLYFALRFAETCVFAKQSPGLLTAALSGLHPNRAPLLPKLRGHFAEFLNKSSLDHLRILSSPTCVGLRYGHLSPR